MVCANALAAWLAIQQQSTRRKIVRAADTWRLFFQSIHDAGIVGTSLKCRLQAAAQLKKLIPLGDRVLVKRVVQEARVSCWRDNLPCAQLDDTCTARDNSVQ